MSGEEDSAVLPPSGVAALPESDPEMAAMLSRGAVSIKLQWNPPPCHEPSRLDDWYIGVARAGSQRSAPVPFFPEVHEEVTKTWTAPFSARSWSGPSSSLTTLAAIDLKDAYFHVSIFPRHRPFQPLGFPPNAMAGWYWSSLRTSCANTGTWCSVTSTGWDFGVTGKTANSPLYRGSYFSVWSWTLSAREHDSQRSASSKCWIAWIRLEAGQRPHWNLFRGSWGIWHPQPQ